MERSKLTSSNRLLFRFVWNDRSLSIRAGDSVLESSAYDRGPAGAFGNGKRSVFPVKGKIEVSIRSYDRNRPYPYIQYIHIRHERTTSACAIKQVGIQDRRHRKAEVNIRGGSSILGRFASSLLGEGLRLVPLSSCLTDADVFR